MITLIGNTESAIGFGLCGIDDIHELDTPDKEKIIKVVKESSSEIIMIDKQFYDMISDEITTEKVIIPIPKQEDDTYDIEELVKDRLGMRA